LLWRERRSLRVASARNPRPQRAPEA
jgi:hypothetical protein